MKTITILTKPDGSVQIGANGFIGEACHDATSAFSKALGLVTSDIPTHELYLAQVSPETVMESQS